MCHTHEAKYSDFWIHSSSNASRVQYCLLFCRVIFYLLLRRWPSISLPLFAAHFSALSPATNPTAKEYKSKRNKTMNVTRFIQLPRSEALWTNKVWLWKIRFVGTLSLGVPVLRGVTCNSCTYRRQYRPTFSFVMGQIHLVKCVSAIQVSVSEAKKCCRLHLCLFLLIYIGAKF